MLWLLFWGMAAVGQDQTGIKQLEQMAHAAQVLNYEGVFTFQSGNQLQSIRIVHRADETGDVERLMALDGVPREVIRTNEQVTCVYPEGQPVQANHRPLGRGFPIELLQHLLAAAPYYEIYPGKQRRIANHQAQQWIIRPVDIYRYGYQLWADKTTHLLLQADLLNPAGQVLQRFVFSSVNINTPIDEQLLALQMKGNTMTWNRQRVLARKSLTLEPSPWQVTWLPEGFTLRLQQNKVRAQNGALIEQRVYSDGLNSLSVFFEKIRAQHQHLRGGIRRGIVNVFGTIQNGHFVTVIGEVPAQTVEKVALSIRYTR